MHACMHAWFIILLARAVNRLALTIDRFSEPGREDHAKLQTQKVEHCSGRTAMETGARGL
jgi:hypothetical protein